MAVKHLGKNGMFLTFISIAIIAAAILIFTPSDINLSKGIPAIKTRVSNLDEYVLDLQDVYLERTLQATGRKTLIGLTKWMENPSGTSRFFADFADFEDSFSEALLYGTIKGEDMDIYYPAYDTYGFWIEKVAATAKDVFNVDTVYGISDIRVYQTKPWFVSVDADFSFNVSSETASWNKTATITTEIEIEGFEDPYYLVKTEGNYANLIHKSGTKFNEWTVDKVKDFIRDGNYTHFQGSDAPSFLQRFYDDVSASPCCGIESFVNPNHPAISDKDVRYVDYKYWSTTPDCDDAPPIVYLSTETSIGSEFNALKFGTRDLSIYKITDDPSANVQQECPPI